MSELQGTLNLTQNVEGALSTTDGVSGTIESNQQGLSGVLGVTATLSGSLSTENNLTANLSNNVNKDISSYTDLINKPQINSIELSNNKSFEELGLELLTNTEIENLISNN